MTDFILNWKAIYKDGTELFQIGPDGKENKYPDIDRTKLEAFQLFTKGYTKLIDTLVIGEGQRLIYRRRVSVDPISSDILFVVYLIGWQKTVNGKNIQSVHHVTEEFGIVAADEFLNLDVKGKWVKWETPLRPEEQ